MFDSSRPKRKREKTVTTTGGSELGEQYGTTGLDYMWDNILGGPKRYEGDRPFASRPNWFQQQQANSLNQITDQYGGEGGYFDQAKGMYGEVGAMSPDEVAAMNRRGGPAEGYFNPYTKAMKGHLRDDYDESLALMKNEIGAGAGGAGAFGGSRHGAAEGVGGARAMDNYLRAATGIDAQAYENAMQWQREDYQDEMMRAKLRNADASAFAKNKLVAGGMLEDPSSQLLVTAANERLGNYRDWKDQQDKLWLQGTWKDQQAQGSQDWRDYMSGVSGTPWQTDTTTTSTEYGTGGKSNLDKTMGYGAIFAKAFLYCIPEGTKIDTPDGPVPIEDIKVGAKVDSYYGTEAEVTQVHQYKEKPFPFPRFYQIKFDNGGAVDCCDMHRIFGKRAKDCRVGDIINAHKITSIVRYGGVERSYDLLTESIGHPVTTTGYRINNIPVNSMIEELAELTVGIKQAA